MNNPTEQELQEWKSYSIKPDSSVRDALVLLDIKDRLIEYVHHLTQWVDREIEARVEIKNEADFQATRAEAAEQREKIAMRALEIALNRCCDCSVEEEVQIKELYLEMAEKETNERVGRG